MTQPSAHQEQFLNAIRNRDSAAASLLLEQHPEIARADVWCACSVGEPDFVAAALAAEPGLAVAPRAQDGWPPLLYACASLKGDAARCAELLLDHGADPNSHVLWDENDPASRLPALYFACVSGNAPLVRLLLDRGAEPNDGESIYHAAELNQRECLEILAAKGADLSGRHSHWGNTPLYFLAGYQEADSNRATATLGMGWLLEHSADPNVTSTPGDETPLHRVAASGSGLAVAELLLAHGAEVDRPRADGKAAYGLAVRSGNTSVADLLRERGADTSGTAPVDELLGACMRGDATVARELAGRHPELVVGLTAEERQTFALAAREGRQESVRLMAELGFDFLWEGPWHGTPLHHAAWFGNPAMVRLLLDLGAPVNVRDGQFGSSPLAWAAHGSSNCRKADDDYVAVVEMLLAAGADRETSINRWGEPPESMAAPSVAALFGGPLPPLR